MNTSPILFNLNKGKCSLMFLGLLILSALFSNEVKGETILTPPVPTDFGQWGSWEFCPKGRFVTGMQLYTHPPQGIFKDDRGLTGIRLFCNKFGEKMENHGIKSSTDDVGNWGKTYFCPGVMTGMQLRSEKYRTAFVDDTAANNLRIFCDSNEQSYLEGDGTEFGSWITKNLCQANEAVCGLQTQVEKEFSLDQTGLNNVNMKCCDIPHPVLNCVPETTWEPLATCEAVADQDNYCSYTRKVGVSYKDDYTDYTTLHEAIGFGLRKMLSPFHFKFLNVSSDSSIEVVREEFNDLYWQSSPTFVWEPQTLEKVELKAKKGHRVTLFQILGKCGMLQVRGTRMKRLQINTETMHNVTTIEDFTSENEIDYEP